LPDVEGEDTLFDLSRYLADKCMTRHEDLFGGFEAAAQAAIDFYFLNLEAVQPGWYTRRHERRLRTLLVWQCKANTPWPHNRMIGSAGIQHCCYYCHECGQKLQSRNNRGSWCFWCETER